MASLPKHEKYEKAYQPWDLYWGLGIENETYIEFAASVKTTAEFIQRHQKRERYSVDYWKLYKPGVVKKTLDRWIDQLPEKGKTPISFPLLANAHSLEKTDRFGEAKTTYSTTPKPNPKFAGTTLLEDLSEAEQEVFSSGKDVWWAFDGDTIELITQNFYKAKMEDVIGELVKRKREWIEAFRRGLEKYPDREQALQGNSKYPIKNYGFAVFLTNRDNIAIFNNGTYHFNITMPTQLNGLKKINDMAGFKRRHCMAARLFQWLSPFLVAKYGSPDGFANLLRGGRPAFPMGSQRLCASRYVSVGTYDTDEMEPGKVLLIPNKDDEKRWYDMIYSRADCPYDRLPNIGVDINYNKHWNHGLEFRIFDWFPDNEIPYLFRMLIWMCDESLKMETVPKPQDFEQWHKLLARCVWEGGDIRLEQDDVSLLETIFGKQIFKVGKTIIEGYNAIWLDWFYRWNDSKGTCTELMIRNPLIVEGIRHTRHTTLRYTQEKKEFAEVGTQTDAKEYVNVSTETTNAMERPNTCVPFKFFR